MEPTFIERITSRIHPVGLLGAAELRVSVARMGTGVRFGTMAFALQFAVILLWFDKPTGVAASLGFAAAQLVTWSLPSARSSRNHWITNSGHPAPRPVDARWRGSVLRCRLGFDGASMPVRRWWETPSPPRRRS